MGWFKSGDNSKSKMDRDNKDGSFRTERVTYDPDTGKHSHEWHKTSTDGETKSGIELEDSPNRKS